MNDVAKDHLLTGEFNFALGKYCSFGSNWKKGLEYF